LKLGVFTTLYSDTPFKESLDYFKSIGIEMIEIACGGYPGNAHCNPEVLLHDEAKFAEFMKTIQDSGLEVSALSVHSNPVHPDKALREGFQKDMNNAILMAEKMGIHQINTFSGCPGDCENSKYPNWVTCPWPDDFLSILEWQWNEVLIPYWKEEVKFAKAHGVDKIGLELHPGFCVYNTESLLKLRAAVGPEIGANLDPSHIIWQGMDPVAVIRQLGKAGAIFHFHAKDTKVDELNTAVNGVLDTKHYGDEINRSWVFRSVGYGNGYQFWKDIVSNLRLVGYDYAVSIEHEDSIMSRSEGLEKAASLLNEVLIKQPKGAMTWA
jgi:sugar phosphate isomerase/epimerase